MPVHLLLAEDHGVVRKALKSFLESEGFEIVAEAEDGRQAVELAERFCPDAAVLDVAMPFLNGIDAARHIRQRSPRTKVVLLTMLTDDHYVLEALRAGVRGYVLKSKNADELPAAIREVCKGGTYLTASASSAVVEAYLGHTPLPVLTLSDRERQVLQLVAEGNSTKEVACALGISVKTAESHRVHIMEKLNIHQIAGLVRYAIRQGIIQA
jgi:DNA-binding NarL/FixJ family response regulator